MPAGDVEFVNLQVLEFFGSTLDDLKRWGTGGMTHPGDSRASSSSSHIHRDG